MTMKKFCLTLMLCLVAVAATRAQSFIITKSADTLRVYDVEIGYTSVYFKSSRDKEAPLERLSKTKIDHLILVDGQQFTFEGRTPVKEENKTYSVLLCGDRGTAVEKPRRKSKFIVWNAPQWGFMFDYAGKDYKVEATDWSETYWCNGLNAQIQLPYVQMGFSNLKYNDFNDYDKESSASMKLASLKLRNLNIGAHYRVWFGPFYVDPSLGFSYTYKAVETAYRKNRKTQSHEYSRKEHIGAYFYPRVGLRFCNFMAISFAANIHCNANAPSFCSFGLSFGPYKRQK